MVVKGSPYISSTNVTKNPQNTEEEKISGPNNNLSFSHNSSNRAPNQASSGLRGDGYERALQKWKQDNSHLDLVVEDLSNEDVRLNSSNAKESIQEESANKQAKLSS